jgi:hypothetical protein
VFSPLRGEYEGPERDSVLFLAARGSLAFGSLRALASRERYGQSTSRGTNARSDGL